MTANVSNIPARPEPIQTPPVRVFRARRGMVGIDFAELWRYRELFLFLAWRDILVRYKQTALGVSWAVIQPLLMTVVFTLVFNRLAGMGTNGAPAMVFSMAALLPWQFFSNAMSESSNSLVASASMISKVYFPRLIVPASAVLSGMIDFLISVGLLFAMMVCFRVKFLPNLLLLPVFLLAAMMAAMACGVWLSALNVKYRDVKYVVPFFTRVGLYACPVGYMTSDVARKLGPQAHFLYCLNPMVGVIDGFRWCVFGKGFAPYWPGFALSMGATAAVLATAVIYFRTTEKRFADVI